MRTRLIMYIFLMVLDVYMQNTMRGLAYFNMGIAFGIPYMVSTALLVIILFAMIWWIVINYDLLEDLQREGSYMIVIGGLGNLIARLIMGGVVDYINIALLRVNVSDLIIFMGVLSIVSGAIIKRKIDVK